MGAKDDLKPYFGPFFVIIGPFSALIILWANLARSLTEWRNQFQRTHVRVQERLTYPYMDNLDNEHMGPNKGPDTSNAGNYRTRDNILQGIEVKTRRYLKEIC